ncbi:hypothetical protein ACUTAH_24635 [Metapseudomonas furukawaii]|uniref:hypothetical protein n=1 Tax=Metapseudomonas furukawaii TaxID=1149133 RepID=UPI0040457393
MHHFAVFSHPKQKKTDEFRVPNSPFVSIALGWHFTLPSGEILLSAQLMTESEIDHAFDSLEKELDEGRRAAKKKLRELIAHNEHEFPRNKSS